MSDRIDKAPWQAIPRAMLRDPRLSPRAKGGLVCLLSHDEGWVRSCVAILMKENDCGREQAQAILRELVKAGYATRTQGHKADGRFTTFYTVHAEPVSSDASSSGLPPTGPPATVPPDTVTPLAVVEALDVEPREEEPQQEQHLAQARNENPLFEALVEACELTRPFTATQGRAIGVAAAELAKVGATPGEIIRRAGHWSFNVDLTPWGIVKQWGLLAAPHVPKRRPVYDPATERLRRLAERQGQQRGGLV